MFVVLIICLVSSFVWCFGGLICLQEMFQFLRGIGLFLFFLFVKVVCILSGVLGYFLVLLIVVRDVDYMLLYENIVIQKCI